MAGEKTLDGYYHNRKFVTLADFIGWIAQAIQVYRLAMSARLSIFTLKFHGLANYQQLKLRLNVNVTSY